MNEQQNLVGRREGKKSVAQFHLLGDSSRQLFDNPLKKEFLTFPEVVEFFQVGNRYGSKWVRMQMAAGNLPFHTYGRDGIFFYLPEIKQAILSGALVPIRRKVNYDRKTSHQERSSLPGPIEIERPKSLQELRAERGC